MNKMVRVANVPGSITLGAICGTTGHQAVLDNLNKHWTNGATVFGSANDHTGAAYNKFRQYVQENIVAPTMDVNLLSAITVAVGETMAVTSSRALYSIPETMYTGILTEPYIRTMLEDGNIAGWGIAPEALPEEDVVGRMINNCTIDSTDPDFMEDDYYLEYNYDSTDPLYTDEDLYNFEVSREFITDYIEDQIIAGTNIDPTNLINGGEINV